MSRERQERKILNSCGKFPLVVMCLALFLTFTQTEAVIAKKGGKILILNSNMSIEKYALAQAEFKSKMRGTIVEIDLGDKQFDIARIKKTLQEMKPDIIYCIGSKAHVLGHQLPGNNKIIFSSALNWRRLPTGENTYGISNELPSGMQLMMYRYLFPEIKKIGVIYSKKFNEEWLKGAVKDGRDMGIDIVGKSVKTPLDMAPALQELLPKVDVLWLTSDPVVISRKESVVEIFKQTGSMKKPVFAYSEIFASFGALLVISADVPTMGRQAAILADDLLAGNKILEPVAYPAGSHITLNMKKVKKYGIKLNKEALDSVNKIIN